MPPTELVQGNLRPILNELQLILFNFLKVKKKGRSALGLPTLLYYLFFLDYAKVYKVKSAETPYWTPA